MDSSKSIPKELKSDPVKGTALGCGFGDPGWVSAGEDGVEEILYPCQLLLDKKKLSYKIPKFGTGGKKNGKLYAQDGTKPQEPDVAHGAIDDARRKPDETVPSLEAISLSAHGDATSGGDSAVAEGGNLGEGTLIRKEYVPIKEELTTPEEVLNKGIWVIQKPKPILRGEKGRFVDVAFKAHDTAGLPWTMEYHATPPALMLSPKTGRVTKVSFVRVKKGSS